MNLSASLYLDLINFYLKELCDREKIDSYKSKDSVPLSFDSILINQNQTYLAQVNHMFSTALSPLYLKQISSFEDDKVCYQMIANCYNLFDNLIAYL